MNPEQYAQQAQRLRAPQPTVVTEAAQLERLLPHDLREDPEWPTPTDSPSIHRLLSRLPKVSRVVCAVLAAEMALPVWLDWVPQVQHDFTFFLESSLQLPEKALFRVWEWVRTQKPIPWEYLQRYAKTDGRGIPQDTDGSGILQLVGDLAAIHTNPPPPTNLVAVLDAVYFTELTTSSDLRVREEANRYVHSLSSVDAATNAVVSAASAGHQSAEMFQSFLARWWKVCRTRLAFADATTTEVSGPPTYSSVPVRRTVISPAVLVERLHPHNIPDDPEWPAPKRRVQVQQLLHRLQISARVVCTIVAVEMLEAEGRLFSSSVELDRRLVSLMREWLQRTPGTETIARVGALYAAVREEHRAPLGDLEEAPPALLLCEGLFSADGFRSSPASENSEDESVGASYFFSQAICNAFYQQGAPFGDYDARDPRRAPAVKEYEDMLHRWWQRCRITLAFEGADEVVVSGSKPQHPMTPAVDAKLKRGIERFFGVPYDDFVREFTRSKARPCNPPGCRVIKSAKELQQVLTPLTADGSEPKYSEIQRSLTPHRQVRTDADVLAQLHPCDLPEDSAWPTPRNMEEAIPAAVRLHPEYHDMLVWIALELSLPAWEQLRAKYGNDLNWLIWHGDSMRNPLYEKTGVSREIKPLDVIDREINRLRQAARGEPSMWRGRLAETASLIEAIRMGWLNVTIRRRGDEPARTPQGVDIPDPDPDLATVLSWQLEGLRDILNDRPDLALSRFRNAWVVWDAHMHGVGRLWQRFGSGAEGHAQEEQAFLKLWWQHVRCKLAVSGIETRESRLQRRAHTPNPLAAPPTASGPEPKYSDIQQALTPQVRATLPHWIRESLPLPTDEEMQAPVFRPGGNQPQPQAVVQRLAEFDPFASVIAFSKLLDFFADVVLPGAWVAEGNEIKLPEFQRALHAGMDKARVLLKPVLSSVGREVTDRRVLYSRANNWVDESGALSERMEINQQGRGVEYVAFHLLPQIVRGLTYAELKAHEANVDLESGFRVLSRLLVRLYPQSAPIAWRWLWFEWRKRVPYMPEPRPTVEGPNEPKTVGGRGAPQQRMTLFTTCPNVQQCDVNTLIEMEDDGVEISLATFRKWITPLDLEEFERNHGYVKNSRHGLTLANDYHVRYYKSHWGTYPCVFVDWSAIDHIYLNPEDIQEVNSRTHVKQPGMPNPRLSVEGPGEPIPPQDYKAVKQALAPRLQRLPLSEGTQPMLLAEEQQVDLPTTQAGHFYYRLVVESLTPDLRRLLVAEALELGLRAAMLDPQAAGQEQDPQVTALLGAVAREIEFLRRQGDPAHFGITHAQMSGLTRRLAPLELYRGRSALHRHMDKLYTALRHVRSAYLGEEAREFSMVIYWAYIRGLENEVDLEAENRRIHELWLRFEKRWPLSSVMWPQLER